MARHALCGCSQRGGAEQGGGKQLFHLFLPVKVMGMRRSLPANVPGAARAHAAARVRCNVVQNDFQAFQNM